LHIGQFDVGLEGITTCTVALKLHLSNHPRRLPLFRKHLILWRTATPDAEYMPHEDLFSVCFPTKASSNLLSAASSSVYGFLLRTSQASEPAMPSPIPAYEELWVHRHR
jgi:hypothetical protein